MARIMLELAGEGVPSALLLVAVALFVTILLLVLVALCAKRTLSNKRLRVTALVEDEERKADGGEEGFGDGGLWQKSILMGDKCRPLEFSGVIYYDDAGNRVHEMPRSPASSPLRSFTFPMEPQPQASYKI